MLPVYRPPPAASRVSDRSPKGGATPKPGSAPHASYAARITTYATQQGWRSEASRLLIEVTRRGEIARGDVDAITGLGERTARALLSQLIQERMLGSDSEKGPVSLRLPVKALDVLFPRLFFES